MSFRKNSANWQWRYFSAPGIPDVLENFTGFIDDSLDLGDGRSITGKNFAFSPEGMMNIFDVIPDAENHKTLDRTIITADFYADDHGSFHVGMGADWFWTLRVNGKMLLDARKTANSEFPISPSNHLVEIKYQPGRNQIILETFSAFRHRGNGGGMDVAFKITEKMPDLSFKYEAFTAFPDAMDNAVSVIFTGSRNSPAAVDFRMKGEEKWQRIYDNLGGQIRHDRTVHTIRIAGLVPDTVYEYRPILPDDCGQWQEISGEINRFRTAPEDGKMFRFTATADLQIPAQRREYLSTMLTGKEFQPDFFAFLGDLNWTSDFDKMVMDDFIVPFGKITEQKIPLVMVRGNHEMYGKESFRYFEYFSIPFYGRESYGMFRYGDVCFFILDFGDDTGRMPQPSTRQFHDIEPLISAEAQWLRAAVNHPACKEAKYRIVLAHGIPAGDVQEYMPSHVRQVIDPVFGGTTPQCRIHLWLGGHIHRPFRSVPGKKAFYSILPPEQFCQEGENLQECWQNYHFPILATGGPLGKTQKNMQLTSFEVTVDANGISVDSLDREQNIFDHIFIAPDGSVTEKNVSGEFKYYEF